MNKPPIHDIMLAYAEDAVSHAKRNGTTLDYSENGIAAVESLLAQLYQARPKGFFAQLLRKGPSDEDMWTVAKMYGCYIGEVFRRAHPGWEWFVDEEVSPGSVIYGLRKSDSRFWPPAKVMKRLTKAQAFS